MCTCFTNVWSGLLFIFSLLGPPPDTGFLKFYFMRPKSPAVQSNEGWRFFMELLWVIIADRVHGSTILYNSIYISARFHNPNFTVSCGHLGWIWSFSFDLIVRIPVLSLWKAAQLLGAGQQPTWAHVGSRIKLWRSVKMHCLLVF